MRVWGWGAFLSWLSLRRPLQPVTVRLWRSSLIWGNEISSKATCRILNKRRQTDKMRRQPVLTHRQWWRHMHYINMIKAHMVWVQPHVHSVHHFISLDSSDKSMVIPALQYDHSNSTVQCCAFHVHHPGLVNVNTSSFTDIIGQLLQGTAL